MVSLLKYLLQNPVYGRLPQNKRAANGEEPPVMEVARRGGGGAFR